MIKRKAGILMPIFSLPGEHGIGDFGKCCWDMVDLSKKAGFSIWQILPLNPVGYGNSPYAPYSSFAGDEIYINLDGLFAEGLIQKKAAPFALERIDYQKVRAYKQPYFDEAFKTFKEKHLLKDEYQTFINMAFWLDDYVRYIVLKKKNKLKAWQDWSCTSLSYDDEEAICYEKFIQFIFFKQWEQVRHYANKKGLEIVGDLPMYVGLDSADVYGYKKAFMIDEKGKPSWVAGCPPDCFTEDGQLWGNPLYNWKYLKEHAYDFWVNRLKWNMRLFDIVRLDHFRAFDTYWAIPYGDTNARRGHWELGPAYDLFDVIFEKLPNLNLIAEDLGDLRKEVLELRDHYHLLGMRVAQHALGETEEKVNFVLPENIVVYPGTHDNLTVEQWIKECDKKELKRIKTIFKKLKLNGELMSQQLIDYCYQSPCRIAIISMPDLLALGQEARLNAPGVCGSPNWEWKLQDFESYKNKVEENYQQLRKYKRI